MFLIKYIPEDGPQLTLVDWASGTYRDWNQLNFKVNHQPIIQVSNLLEADYAVAFPSFNRRNLVSFDVMRGVNGSGVAFKDAQEAALFMIDHAPAIPDEGVLLVTLKGGIGGDVSRFFTNALFVGCEPTSEIGVSMFFNYKFNCGKALNAAPPGLS